MPIFHWDVDQNSADWLQLRAGRPTASEFHRVMTPKQMKPAEARLKYAAEIIAERLVNWQKNSLDKIDHIADGKKNEPIAIARLELIHEIETTPVGFVTTNDGRFGASPDRVAGINADRTRVSTVIEAKSPTVPIQIGYLIHGHDDAYRCQVQGQLLVCEADKAIFQAYNPHTPDYMVETGRDEPFIRSLSDCLERFSDELEAWTERAKAAGTYQPYARLLTPAEAEYAELRQRAESDEDVQAILDSQKAAWGG